VQTIGLVGGMSWESSLVYYRDLNLGVQERLGGLSSPKLVLSAVDFAELTALEDAERWDRIGQLLSEAAQGVERAGAVGPDAMEYDPNPRDRIHLSNSGPEDLSGNFLRPARAVLKREEQQQITYGTCQNLPASCSRDTL